LTLIIKLQFLSSTKIFQSGFRRRGATFIKYPTDRKALNVVPNVKTIMQSFSKILFILFLFTSCDLKSSKDYLNDAEKLEDEQKYKEAIQTLDKAISKDKKFLGAYINRGADKSALGDFKGAIEDYEKVIALDPKNTLALFNIGNNYNRLNNYKKAVDYYDKAMETKGGDSYIDYTPNSFVDMSQFDVPGHEILFQRGIALFYIDSLKKSYTDLKRCIEKDYMKAECYYWIAYIYLKTGQNEIACEHFNKARLLGDTDAEEEIKKYCNK
jgi:tetratricopeptide (TPR) repeat protein